MIDRFARTAKIKDGGIVRARKLRSNPTHAEAKLWKHLRPLPLRFRRQAPIGPYVVDFACHPARLVIEVDGGIHNLPEVALRDLQRDEWLRAQGYHVLRFTNRQVEDDIGGVLETITAATPFPLAEGERAGDGGGGTASPASQPDFPAPTSDSYGVTVPPGAVRASTPSQPFPLEGKGSSES